MIPVLREQVAILFGDKYVGPAEGRPVYDQARTLVTTTFEALPPNATQPHIDTAKQFGTNIALNSLGMVGTIAGWRA